MARCQCPCRTYGVGTGATDAGQGYAGFDGGWVEKQGWTTFNLDRPPTLVPRAGNITPWLDLVKRLYPNEAYHIVQWLAQRVQSPEININHALVLGGSLGIGRT